ncbi:MAG: hypothetical protein V1663_03900 [archaeon]
MAFFKDKKKNVMDLPKPDMSLELPKFPEPDTSDVEIPKRSFERDFSSFEAPKQRGFDKGSSNFERPKQRGFERDFSNFEKPVVNLSRLNTDRPIEDLEVESREPLMGAGMGGKPLFVRIEKYHEAMNDLRKIKEKLKEAEKVLFNIIEIKKEEDNELNMWREDILDLKNKMNKIDNVLFEMR